MDDRSLQVQPEANQDILQPLAARHFFSKRVIVIVVVLFLVSVAMLCYIIGKNQSTSPPRQVKSNRENHGNSQMSQATSKVSTRGNTSGSNTVSLGGSLPACPGNAFLTSLPTDVSNIDYIIPLGNNDPIAGHVLPSDHIYFSMKKDAGNHPVLSNVYSPGDVHILQIDNQHITVNGQGSAGRDDYSLLFASCKDVIFYFYHLTSLSPALTSLISSTTPRCTTINLGSTTGGQDCQYSIDYSAKPGELLGTAGGLVTVTTAFDLGSYDTRTPVLDYANPNRSLNGPPDEWKHAACPLDYFISDKKDTLYSFVGNTVKRTIPPLCGTVMQDIKGTAQGNWYAYPVEQVAAGGGSQGGQDKQIALVHSNIDPSKGVISVGGTITTQGAFVFTPTHSGTNNREFGEVKPDSNIYCYQTDPVLHGLIGMPLNGKILLQLVDVNTLKVEHQDGNCIGSEKYSNPTTYLR